MIENISMGDSEHKKLKFMKIHEYLSVWQTFEILEFDLQHSNVISMGKSHPQL